ncbi:MAG: hypothetical protein QE263_05605 [Vampirovibrionales bacterium]|nr:hypothetical protein [Vampirovibrionales bacterium]
MKIQNYPPSLWKTIEKTRYAWMPTAGALVGQAIGHHQYPVIEGLSVGYLLAFTKEGFDYFLSLAKGKLFKPALRHELGHMIAAIHEGKPIKRIEKHCLSYYVNMGKNFKKIKKQEPKTALKMLLAGRMLNRLKGYTLEPSVANFDRIDEYKILLKNPKIIRYYLTQARKETEAILRQYPEELIEKILNNLMDDFKKSSKGPVWSRFNNKIQELEARLKAGKIKLDQAG